MDLRFIKSTLKSNKTLVVLIIVSTMLTAIIGCFIYGVYWNYKITLAEGENEEKQIFVDANYSLGILTNHKEDIEEPDNPDYIKAFENEYSCITKADFLKFLNAIPPELSEKIERVVIGFTFDSNLFDIYTMSYNYVYKNEKWQLSDYSGNYNNSFTKEQLENGDKVCVVDADYYDPISSVSIGTCQWSCDNNFTLTENDKYIEVNGEKYEIIGTEAGTSIDDMETTTHILIPFNSLPDDLPMYGQIIVHFKKIVKYNDYMQLKNVVDSTIPDKANVPELELSITSQQNYYKTIIAVTAGVAILFAINLAILYKYIIECNKKRIVIFRICGCRRSRSVRLFLGQAALIIVPFFALSQLVFAKIVYPNMLEKFPNMIDLFTIKLYAVMLICYTFVSLVVLYLLLISSIGKKLEFTEAVK